MNVHALRFPQLVILATITLSIAHGKSFNVSAISVSAPLVDITASGLDWVFLPYEKPLDPKNPKFLPFDSNRAIRGVFTPTQMGVVTRSLSAQNLMAKFILSTTSAATAKLEIPDSKGTVLLFTSPLPENKVLVKALVTTHPAEEATMNPGQTLVLSTVGETTDTINIYFITVTES